jgi:cytochrome P450
MYHYISSILEQLSSSFDYLSADDTLAVWCKEQFSAALEDPRVLRSPPLLRHLLKLKQNQPKEKSIDLLYIAAEILDNITAAEAKIAVTATYLLWKLTESPAWQRRIRKELKALPRQNDGSSAFADVNSQVPSLETCLREVYRLHPSAGGKAERVVPPRGRTLAGTYLPGGVIVSTSVLVLHYHEEVYPGPDVFSREMA